MIGVVTSEANLEMAEEFFELFKTPWEPAVAGRKYRAILSSDGVGTDGLDASVLLVYGSRESGSDGCLPNASTHLRGPVEIGWGRESFPVYGDLATFEGVSGIGTLSAPSGPVDCRCRVGDRIVWRVGYDLFAETRYLLTKGQPVRYARTPTLEFHIAVVRHLLQESAVPFVEVLSRPAGHEFICCLTHDLDFFGIRRHKLDQTLAGFVARASVGTAVEFLRGRRPMVDVLRNWKALFSLPFVQLGLLRDFWSPVEDYREGDGARRSTFFVIPFKGLPGIAPDETVNVTRAVAYEAGEITEELSQAAANGHEVAVHGIDAWRDTVRGRAELAQVPVPPGHKGGVRMHWLYFSEESPKRLEAAGFGYDSTCGYNDAIGYRAGTSQVFRLPGTQALMELPLLIMDSALFFRDRMYLTFDHALRRCREIVAQVRRFGGTLVINWHDRSLAPERLWDRSYRALLAEVSKGNRVWFATAGEAVAWFRWRRSIRFGTDASGHVRVTSAVGDSRLPPACVRVHQSAPGGSESVREISFAGGEPLNIVISKC